MLKIINFSPKNAKTAKKYQPRKTADAGRTGGRNTLNETGEFCLQWKIYH